MLVKVLEKNRIVGITRVMHEELAQCSMRALLRIQRNYGIDHFGYIMLKHMNRMDP